MTCARMLIVDDDPIHSRTLTRTLRRRHFEAVSCRDPDSAITAATAARPDYAIIEQQLDDASGLGLIRPLKAICPAMRILVLTRHASIETAIYSIKLGAWNYMAKPAYVEEILHGLGIDPASTSAGLPGSEPERVHTLDELEWKHILRALGDHGGNVSAAARELKMNRRTLQRKLEAHQEKAGRDIVARIRADSHRRRRIEKRRCGAGRAKTGSSA
ncbi:MAG: response regulator [Betaproteobacteria bacterium]|nr:response regulator [Betaproteobacteria bacterium]